MINRLIKLLLRTLIFIFTIQAQMVLGQNNVWETWDSKYKEINIITLLEREQKYADSTNNDSDAIKFYARQDGYRFNGTFTGEWRELTNERREVMKMTFKIFSGQNEIFDKTKKEIQIQIEDQIIWMPIQHILEKPFKKEIKKGKNVYLYTVFFNYHNQDGTLYNIFFISEFIKL